MSRIDEALRQAGLRSPALDIAPEPSQPPDDFGTTAESKASTTPSPESTAQRPSTGSGRPELAEGRPVARPAVRPVATRPASEVKFAPGEKLVVYPGINRAPVEQYRRIAAALHHMQQDRGLKVLMVASAAMGEGKTLTAANLALTLSESYRRQVLLIDADMRRPSLTAVFHLQKARGLSEQLRGEIDGPSRVLALSEYLALLPGGRPDPDPMASLTSGRMQQIIQQASASYDWVILDTPPLTLQPDASLLAAMVEGIVLVIGAGMAPAASIERAIDAVGRDKVVGVVLNRVSDFSGEADYYQYYPDGKQPPSNVQLSSTRSGP